MDFKRRQWLVAMAAGAAPVFVRHARAAAADCFALGLASGRPQAPRVLRWTRLVGAGLPAQAEVAPGLAEDGGFTYITASAIGSQGRFAVEAGRAAIEHA